jgi:hypothetical protein
MLTDRQAREAVEQYREEGYAGPDFRAGFSLFGDQAQRAV